MLVSFGIRTNLARELLLASPLRKPVGHAAIINEWAFYLFKQGLSDCCSRYVLPDGICC